MCAAITSATDAAIFDGYFQPLELQTLPTFFYPIFRHSQIRESHIRIRYCFDYLGIPHSQDEIRAGHVKEVPRKTKESGVSFARLRAFGLSKKKYDSYPG
jgi:hypothetical protein